MSDRFETRLAAWLHEHLDANPPKEGQKLLAEFHDPETADAFAEGLVELADDDHYPIPGTDDTLPAIETVDGMPLFVARVHSDTVADPAPHDIVQGFATKMRNIVSDSAQSEQPLSILMVLETDTTIDTLEASDNLFGEGGSLDLEQFRKSVLDPETCKTKQGQALLEALNSVLEANSIYAEDVEVLDTLCEIRDEIEAQNAERLPELIADLPEFIREDYIGEDWFTQNASKADLVDSAEEFLADNRDHARQLRRAHRTGTDTESKLRGQYEQEFVNKVIDSASWKDVSHTDAEKNEQKRTSRQFQNLEVGADLSRIFSPMGENRTRKAVVAVPKNGEIKLTAEFSADLEDTPFEFVGPDEAEVGQASVSKYKSQLTAKLTSLSPKEPLYGRLLMYVGKKTTGGKPTHEFDLAVVPRWFFQATSDTPFDVDVDRETVVRQGDDEIHLHPPERIDFDFSEEREIIEISGDDTPSIEFNGPIILDPSPPEAVERVSCLVAPATEIPMKITFLTEVSTAETEEMTFPLMLAAIAEAGRWGTDTLRLPESISIDTDRGEIHMPSEEGIRLEETPLEVIQIEETVIDDRSPQQRLVDAEELRAGRPSEQSNLDEFPSLTEAYDRLFEHFDERGRTPSTDSWDEATVQLVENVLDQYQQAVNEIGEQPDFSQHEPLRGLGTIRSEVAQKVWLTPFHPVMLAYGLRIATWRDETLVPQNATAGFRTERFVEKFNPTGLLPYVVSGDGDKTLLRGLLYESNPLWGVYSPVESPGSVTPAYMERVIRDKLDSFMQSFPLLFELHESRNFVINLINMGDLRPVIKGLYEFFKRVEKSDFDPPQVLLRIYGGPAEGEALDRFFGDSSQSRLRAQLEQKNDEIVDRLRSNLTYVRQGDYVEHTHKEAHMTFFRGLLAEDAGITQVGDLPSGMLLDGLLPREAIDVQTKPSGTVYSVGYGCDSTDTGTAARVSRLANTLEAGASNNGYLDNHVLKKTIQSSHRADLKTLWDDSLWVVHIQPNVGLEFYIESENEIGSDDGMVMIHYNDQYDSSSPNYDAITSTTKHNPYLTALSRALTEANLADHLPPEKVLSTLIAIDGELALELQRAETKEIVEKTGFVGGLALSKQLLETSTEGYAWIPLSLNELSRHDRSRRGGTPGLLQYNDSGAASDDLCLVGIPEDLSSNSVKLWIVETKGGSSSLKKGREQVTGALENLRGIFQPETNYSDAPLVHAEFGKAVVDVARRMQSYDVLDSVEMDVVDANQIRLTEGEFDIEFLTDAKGHVGEVIRVQQDTFKSDVKLDHQVRTLNVPLKSLNLLGASSIESVLPDLNVSHLAFDLASGSLDSQRKPAGQSVEADPAVSNGAHTEETEVGQPTDNTETESPTASVEAEKSVEDADSTEEWAWVDEDDELESGHTTPHREREEPVTEETPEPQGTEAEEDDRHDDFEDDEYAEKAEDVASVGAEDVPDDGDESELTDDLSTGSSSDRSGSNAGRTGHQSMQSVLSKMTKSQETEAKIDRSKLVDKLKREFESLGVQIHPPNPASISVGPRKIGVDVHPKEGQTVEGILQKLNSLSVHIQAHGDIIGAPNPSKGAVRLEIPHDEPTSIYLRDGIEALQDELTEPVTVPLGVDVENEHHALPMLREKHALVGGATGSGKSNFLSTIVSSLAITQDPSALKMSILDPKGVDFGRFASLPHVQNGTYLDTPEECTQYLMQMLDDELPRRKERLQETGFTSVSELNEYADEMGHDPMPYHVIIIDEYADLIMSLGDNESAFEDAVTRLAQVGRAHGIVMFLATQRPSADIVSGKIKANFPCRISFRLPSNTDSRVILDEPGAEDLHGAGDMIVHTQEDKYRLQGYRLDPRDAIAVKEVLGE
ncbi:FtsK/SpoIIIE domain-containing protein [Haloarchaeobius sp. DYHT-AS-18]|uniref:FtsK/SpoIIIE domain-containing protein n=1 Tax=Haloarchaeobius sp. DYHT-AS-18 TaxID=3446117 RepID=UPI003EB9549E